MESKNKTEALSTLKSQITSLPFKTIGLSDYGVRYYAYDLRKIDYMLESYLHQLDLLQNKSQKKLSDLVIVDHGGGVGIFSLLCKRMGVKKIIHQDINPVISNDARIIAEKLGLAADEYIAGDELEMKNKINSLSYTVDAVCSRNVIEHVYDVKKFYAILSKIKSPDLTLLFSTTANNANPLVRWYTQPIQRDYENKGFSDWDRTGNDISKSGLKQREKIIAENFNQFTKEEIEKIAFLTRGKRKDDIIKSCQEYAQSKTLPTLIKHPTNSCDPETGSWVENLLPLSFYKDACRSAGFNFEFKNGFYNTKYPQWYLNLVTPIFNLLIKLLGKNGIILAPFITIIANKKS
jgi:SAM-dependent methyltransferase